MSTKTIAERIIAMKNADLELREKLVLEGRLSNGYNEDMQDLHNKNAIQLGTIIDQIGYPTSTKVGEEANEAAWLIIQHSIGQPDFMRKCAELLAIEVEKGKANPKQLAYLTDRIACLENRPQVYGTSFDWNENGQLMPLPIDDIAHVNDRRKALGLNTLEEQTHFLRKQAALENETPPQNFSERKKAIMEWKRKVGWIKG